MALEYAVPSVPGDSVVVIVSGAAVTDSDILADAVCAGLSASVTTAVKLNVPLTVGVPETTPVPAARLSPVGKLPELIDQL